MTVRVRRWALSILLSMGAAATAGACVAETPRLAPRSPEPLRVPVAVAEERPIEGEGACAPAGHPDTAFTACCAGSPCSGYCVLNTRTQVTGCRCFESEGGCPTGQICCKAKGCCATPEECFRSGKTPEP
jgi:hypothetical protein